MFGNLPDWQVYGIPALIWVVAIINYLRENWGLPTKWVFPVASLFGVFIGGMLYLSSLYDWALVAMQLILGGILLGLASSGYYSGTKYNIERRH